MADNIQIDPSQYVASTLVIISPSLHLTSTSHNVLGLDPGFAAHSPVVSVTKCVIRETLMEAIFVRSAFRLILLPPIFTLFAASVTKPTVSSGRNPYKVANFQNPIAASS